MTLDELWNTPATVSLQSSVTPPSGAAGQYLAHSLAADSVPAYAVRLRMHGEIMMKGWHPFTAEQVIHRHRGMIWAATAHIYGIPIRGSDSLIDGEGAMRWKVLGLFPVMTASGPDLSRSGAGRVNIESIWLPPILSGDDVAWTSSSESTAHASFTANGEAAEITFTLQASGALRSVSMPRWGNPDGGAFRYVNFGAYVDEEITFAGYSIPSRVRVGWYFGSPRFEEEGEFFRATIDDAVFR